MRTIKLCLPILAVLLAPAAHAQWTVFDPTNYANALDEYRQLQQMYATAVETRDQVIAAYDLAYQMSQVPQNLAARYQSEFAQWASLSAPNTYGNTAAWVAALNTGDPAQAAQAYNAAVVQARSYPAGSYASLDPETQAAVAGQYAGSELAQGMTTGALATLGAIRSDAQAFALKLANLEADTYSNDPAQQTENALLAKISTAAMLEIHAQQDANQILAASVQQQLVAEKQQIDAGNRALNGAIDFQQNFAPTMQGIGSGVGASLHAISLSPAGR